MKAKKIMLDKVDYETSLGKFYTNVANSLGHKESSTTQYDCRKIEISENIQSKWYQLWAEQFDATPIQITQLLLMSGPKVNPDLKDDEVLIYEDFITD
jgi:hypothetical protein